MTERHNPDHASDRKLILGIDPGLNITGYGLIEACRSRPLLVEAGVIRSSRSDSLSRRLTTLYAGVEDVITSLQPTTIAMEELYSHYERPRTAILMGHARGVLCLAAGQQQLPIAHYAATQIKRILTGNGRASKKQVQLAVARQLALEQVPEPPDVADALAVAMCHQFMSQRPASLT